MAVFNKVKQIYQKKKLKKKYYYKDILDKVKKKH